MKRSCWGFCHGTGEPKELWPDFLLKCVTDLSFIQNIVIAFLKGDANVFQFPKTEVCENVYQIFVPLYISDWIGYNSSKRLKCQRHMRIVTLSYDTRETNNQTFNCVFIHWCSNKDIHKISHLHTVAAWTQNQCNGGQSQLTNVPQKQLSRLR